LKLETKVGNVEEESELLRLETVNSFLTAQLLHLIADVFSHHPAHSEGISFFLFFQKDLF